MGVGAGVRVRVRLGVGVRVRLGAHLCDLLLRRAQLALRSALDRLREREAPLRLPVALPVAHGHREAGPCDARACSVVRVRVRVRVGAG